MAGDKYDMVRSFKAFMESRAYAAFDALGAEEYFATVKDAPDCMPSNVREWTKVSEQIDRMADLVRRARAKDPSVSECTTDSAIRKAVLAGDPYKKSIFEIQSDVMVHLDHPSKFEFQNSRRMAEFAEHLEHFGFPARMKAHMSIIRSVAAALGKPAGTFSYDKRGDAVKYIVRDVKKAVEDGIDVSVITINTRINVGGPMEIKGGANRMAAPHWTRSVGQNADGASGFIYIGAMKYDKTINLSIESLEKLSDAGVREIQYSGGVVISNIYGECPKMRIKSQFIAVAPYLWRPETETKIIEEIIPRIEFVQH